MSAISLVRMQQKTTLCGSDLAGKLAVLEMALGNMLNTHRNEKIAHEVFLGVYELCGEVKAGLDRGGV